MSGTAYNAQTRQVYTAECI